MNKILLSICIPTYNRENYLASTLESIVSQLDENTRSKVEICISDNASSDGTEALVEEYRRKHPHIVFYRWPENMGADRNYLRVVEIASGEYCWLFGSDDLMLSGSIKRVLAEIKTQPDIVLYQREESDMQPGSEPVYLSWADLSGDFDFESVRQRDCFLHYLAACRSFGGLFSYLSVIVFRRLRWQEIANKDRFVGSAYVHVHTLLAILKQGAVFHYRTATVVLCRMGNDSFLSDDSIVANYRRIRLDINGYREIPSYVFGCDTEEYHFIRILIGKNLPIPGIMKYKLAYISMGDHDGSNKIDRILLSNGFILKYVVMKFIGIQPLPKILSHLSFIRRKTRKIISKL